jgi:hypothetical protein
MNPFTQFLARPLARHQFVRFVKKWDQVEQLIINTFREQGDLLADMKTWRRVSRELQHEYPLWVEKLTPLWLEANVDGKPAEEDPFLALLRVEELSAFRQNWRAMQTLPAAREAINRFLIGLNREGES